MEFMVGWVLAHHCATRAARERHRARPPRRAATGADRGPGGWSRGLLALLAFSR